MIKVKLNTEVTPPRFPTDFELEIDFVTQEELAGYLTQLNDWLSEHYTTLSNFGWFFLCPCAVKFVKNDLMLRRDFPVYVRKCFRQLIEEGVSVALRRVVRVYGFGESSTTVVKYAVILKLDQLEFTHIQQIMAQSLGGALSSSNPGATLRRQLARNMQAQVEQGSPPDVARGRERKQTITLKTPDDNDTMMPTMMLSPRSVTKQTIAEGRRTNSFDKGKEEEGSHPEVIQMDDLRIEEEEVAIL